MKNISFFCLTLDPSHEKIIKSLSYIPVGLGKKNFSTKCLSDKEGKSISSKNPFYGEYTFHYWIWKNYINKIQTKWVGFCQYRKFFLKKKIEVKHLDFSDLQENIIKSISDNEDNFDCILGEKFSVENYKFSKVIKNYFFDFLKNPSAIFSKKKRTLKLHFDLYHGKNSLDTAINLLNSEDKYDFKHFMNNQTSFNPHNMFICRTEILKKYYETIFPWLEKCEKVFGFENLNGYGMQRIYGFLAERFLSYWFNKNYKSKEYPIIVKDLSDYKDL